MSNTLITLISHPRSGSSYFIDEVGKLGNIHAMMEIFHPNDAVVQQHLGEFLDVVRRCLQCPQDGLREAFISDPIRYLSIIQEQLNTESLIFKVFPAHLPREKVEDVIDHSDLVVVLLRNVLHSYISSEVAKVVGRYANVDTSTTKVEFSESAFLWWINFITEHFEHTFSHLSERKRSALVINYEDLQFKASVAQWISREFSKRLKCDFEISEVNSRLKRQDNRESALDKVSNPDEMMSCLVKYKLSYLIDGQTPSKYSDLRRLSPAVPQKNSLAATRLSESVNRMYLWLLRAVRKP